jgi:hypothetical protein
VQVAPLEFRLVLELLHEVAVPVQAAHERADRRGVGRIAGLAVAAEGAHRRLVGLAHGQRAEGEVRGQPRAGLGGRGGARHRAPVVPPAGLEEGRESVERSGPPAALPCRARIGVEPERGAVGQRVRVERGAADGGRRRDARCRHQRLPGPRPAITALETADDAVLRPLPHGHPGRARPAPDRAVALVGPQQSGLLVRVQRGDAVTRVQAGQHVDRLPHAQREARAAAGERGIQLDERLPQEVEVAARHLGLAPEPRLQDVERQHRMPGRRGGGERRVVVHPQVTLEPDDGDHRLAIRSRRRSGASRVSRKRRAGRRS